MGRYESSQGKLVWGVSLLIAAVFMLWASTCDAKAQVVSIGITPSNPGLGLTYKKKGFVSTVNYNMINKKKHGIDVDFNRLKFGAGASFDKPNIFGTWDKASFDVIFCANHYFGSSKQYIPSVLLIPSASYYYKDKLRFLTIEIGTHMNLVNNVVVGFHWDVMNDEYRLNFGVKLLNKNEKRKKQTKKNSLLTSRRII